MEGQKLYEHLKTNRRGHQQDHHSFIVKALKEVGIEETYLNMKKTVMTIHSQHGGNGEKLRTFICLSVLLL